MYNYNHEPQNTLAELEKQKEKSDRLLLTLEWVIGALSIIVLLIPALIAEYFPMQNWQRLILIFSGLIPCIVGIYFTLKIEQVAGYYQCSECGHRYIPAFKAIVFSKHMCRTRYMRCPLCGEKSWQKKVIGNE